MKSVLIAGSGLSYHNLRNFGSGGRAPSKAFDVWLQEAMVASPSVRAEALVNWESAPAARICHPREEHLLPLMVAVGAAYDDAGRVCVSRRDRFWRRDRLQLPFRRDSHRSLSLLIHQFQGKRTYVCGALELVVFVGQGLVFLDQSFDRWRALGRRGPFSQVGFRSAGS